MSEFTISPINDVIPMAFQGKDGALHVGYVVFHFLFPDLCHISVVHQDLKCIFNGQTGSPRESLYIELVQFFGMVSCIRPKVPPLV